MAAIIFCVFISSVGAQSNYGLSLARELQSCNYCGSSTDGWCSPYPPCSVCPCNNGNYCPGDRGSYACGPGFSCPGQGSVCPGVCGAGSFCTGGAAASEVCPTGSFCPPLSSSPEQCPGGTYRSATGGQTYKDCTPCPAGTSSPSGSPSLSSCAPCASGSVAMLPGSPACMPCAPGTTPSLNFTQCVVPPVPTASATPTASITPSAKPSVTVSPSAATNPGTFSRPSPGAPAGLLAGAALGSAAATLVATLSIQFLLSRAGKKKGGEELLLEPSFRASGIQASSSEEKFGAS